MIATMLEICFTLVGSLHHLPFPVKKMQRRDFEAEATPKINPKIHGLNFVTVAER
jgi:hypothetical protein